MTPVSNGGSHRVNQAQTNKFERNGRGQERSTLLWVGNHTHLSLGGSGSLVPGGSEVGAVSQSVLEMPQMLFDF